MTTNETRIDAMASTFTDRIKNPEVKGQWIIWQATVSEQTLAKFVKRAKDAGIPGVWSRDGKVGCKAV